MKDLQEKLRNRELVKGTIVLFGEPCITELLGKMGFDTLWIDTEHTAQDYQELLTHLMAASSAGCPALVRVAWNDPILIKKVLEQGPAGIIIPMVNSNGELDAAIKSTLYPPYGTRGFGPLRAVSYGLDDQREYIKWSKTGLIRCVQIETKEGVDAMEQMVKNPYVDCFIIGPCDLSASAGELFEVNGEATQALIRKAASLARENGKSIGIATGWESYDELKRLEDMGINVFFVGSDAQYLINHGKEVLKTLGRI